MTRNRRVGVFQFQRLSGSCEDRMKDERITSASQHLETSKDIRFGAVNTVSF